MSGGPVFRGRIPTRGDQDLEFARLRHQAGMQAARGMGGLLRRQMLSNRLSDLEPPALSESEPEADSDESSSTESTSEEEDKKKRKSKKEKQKEKGKSVSSSRRRKGRGNVVGADDLANLFAQLKPTAATSNDPLDILPPPPPPPGQSVNATDIAQQVVELLKQQEQAAERRKPGKSGSKIAFKRLDHVYDRKIHNFKLKETVKSDPKREEYDQVSTSPCLWFG